MCPPPRSRSSSQAGWRAHDGFPDIAFEPGQTARPAEIQMYPIAKYESVGVNLDLRKPDGSWAPGSADRLIGKE